MERIVDQRQSAIGDTIEYKVKWKGYTGKKAYTWEPAENIIEEGRCCEALDEFKRQQDKGKKKPPAKKKKK